MNNEILLSNIQELCKKNNVAIANLEKKIGIGAGTISRWKKANPSFDKIMAIAKYFNVSIDYLSGYTVESTSQEAIDEKTVNIIDYLLEMTMEKGESESFWQYYKEGDENSDNLLISGLAGTEADLESNMYKLLYAADEMTGYLLEAVYKINDYYDYDTQLRLYLVLDESTEPVIECSNKRALQPLFVAAIRKIEQLKVQKNTKEKVENIRDEIVRKFNKMRE